MLQGPQCWDYNGNWATMLDLFNTFCLMEYVLLILEFGDLFL